MASIILDRSVQSRGPTQRKRNQTHLSLPSPSKRVKTGGTSTVPGSQLPSSPSRLERTGRGRAEEWFDDTNKNASGGASFSDNDPPFYINRQPSSDGNSVCAVYSDGASLRHSALDKPTAPTRSLLARMESSESNSEDFRSVIDDLTIQNKKLKKKLRQYEKLHCSHLEREKLFEVRIHGLAGHRKRELEQTLRSFASSIEEHSPEQPTVNSVSSRQPGAASEPLNSLQATATGGFPSSESIATIRKPSSASTSCSKPIDSAYASMSTQTGTSQFQSLDKRRHDSLAQASQKKRSVQSYLHDIPETLVPKHTLVMSERSKSKLVVKRLEQIFSGKGAASRFHTQSHQQQEVSHSAAQADQSRGRRLAREGVREARILPLDADLQVDSLSEANKAARQSRQSSRDSRVAQASRDESPDQRPTRPLDLDLHRAQVPEDNIDYIRHLGLSSPTASIKSDPHEGWVYLNLLTSMAQLHTLNVTPQFVRQAVAEVSSKFQLSADGTKVRWLGGAEGTRLSSDSEDISETDKLRSTDISTPASTRGSYSKGSSKVALQDHQEPHTALPHPKYESSTDPDRDEKRRPIFLHQVPKASAFHYKPLFFHGTPSDDSNDSDMVTNSVPSSEMIENATAMNSGVNSGSHGMHETEVNLRRQNTENGPIIFYHKARFCTDLSGDPSGAHFDEDAYYRYTQDPIGSSADELNKSLDNDQNQRPEPMDVDFESTKTDGSTLDLEDLKSCISECFTSTSSLDIPPLPMAVSGLGGVQPEDNFVINVKVKHQNNRMRSSPLATNAIHRAPKQFLSGKSTAASIQRSIPRSQPLASTNKSEVVATRKTELQPSSLPPPSYACLPFSSSGSESEEDDAESYLDSNDDFSQSPREIIGNSKPNPPGHSVGSSSDETKGNSYQSTSAGSGDDDDDDDDDDSIDLLAHARELDPDTIAARERDFDNIVFQSGSVTATAGESTSELMKTVPMASSDVDSMSVDGDGRSGMDDSE